MVYVNDEVVTRIIFMYHILSKSLFLVNGLLLIIAIAFLYEVFKPFQLKMLLIKNKLFMKLMASFRNIL